VVRDEDAHQIQVARLPGLSLGESGLHALPLLLHQHPTAVSDHLVAGMGLSDDGAEKTHADGADRAPFPVQAAVRRYAVTVESKGRHISWG
jgi:hypothetical protein